MALIAVCTLTFIWQLSLGQGQQAAVYALGVIPAVLFDDARLVSELEWVAPVLTPITSMFLHGGILHLAGNMLYLWIFGNNIEDAMGHARVIVFYLLCGVAAVFAQALPDTSSTIPMIGAIGAISGVLGAYLLLYPHARVLVLISLGFFLHTMRLKAGIVLGIWFVMQVFKRISTRQALVHAFMIAPMMTIFFSMIRITGNRSQSMKNLFIKVRAPRLLLNF